MPKTVAILGGKESGVGAALLAQKEGYEVWVSDFGMIPDSFKQELAENKIDFEEGKHTEEKILTLDLVIKSPGIPEKAPIVRKLREAGRRIVSEVEFASWFTDANLIGITGSNGKTTTALLVHEMMQAAKLNVACGGNIGNSFARLVAEGGHDHYVIELSSFQLDDIESFRPHIGILTNITPDHLDRYHNSLSEYAESKFRISLNQTEEDHFIYCMDDEVTMNILPNKDIKSNRLGFAYDKIEGAIAWFQNNNIHLEMNRDRSQYNYELMAIQGRHNVYNTMAAAVVGKILDLRKEVVRDAFTNFKNVEHRLEKVAQVRGVEFINDSKATNVNSAWFALESLNKPVVWIAGGVDKGNNYDILKPLVTQKVKSIVALGKDVKKLHEAFSRDVDMIVNAQDMEDAVRMAYHLANKGDAVLLSPACASFDLFLNYEDRGRQFKKLVREL